MITFNGKDYYTWDDMFEMFLQYIQKHGITLEKIKNERGD